MTASNANFKSILSTILKHLFITIYQEYSITRSKQTLFTNRFIQSCIPESKDFAQPFEAQDHDTKPDKPVR